MSTQEKLPAKNLTWGPSRKRIRKDECFDEKATKIPSTKSSSPTATSIQKKEIGDARTSIPSTCIRFFEALAVGVAQNENFVFSPCSIHLALSLLANGSSGSTLEELLRFTDAKTLKDLNTDATNSVRALTTTSQGGPKLSFVGGIWVDKSCTLNPSFQSIAQTVYKGKAEEVDFISERKVVADNVNRWVEEATNGIIKDIVSEALFDQLTRLVFANALYFKGKWTAKKKFEKSLTKDLNFFTLDGKFVRVPFMTNKKKNQFIASFEDFKVLRLPYEKNWDETVALSMYIILPNKRDGLWPLVKKAGSEPSFFEKYARPDTRKVKVGKFKVPRFKTTFEIEASNILKSLGLQLPFSNEAEFGKMVDLEPGQVLYVSSVVHKSYIKVDEEGTEASACTRAKMKLMCRILNPPPPVDFVADHPFMFVIRDDNTGMVLFMGHVINPNLP